MAKLKTIAQLENREAGLFLAKTEDGRIWKQKLDIRRRQPAWEEYSRDPLQLSLEGKTLELEMLEKLVNHQG